MRPTQQEYEIDLRELFFVIKSKLLVIILSGMIGALAAGLFSYYLIDPVYSSTSKLYILTQSTSITSLSDIQVGTSLTSDYMELIKSRPVVEQVIKDTDLDMDYEQLAAKLSVTNPADTRILNIMVKDGNPRLAKKIADDFASVAQKQISEIMKMDEPSIWEQGHVADSPDSPNHRMNILIGGLLGIFLSMLFVIILHLMDDTLKTPEDVAFYLGLNTLAVIPMRTDKKQAKKKKKKKHAKR